MSINMYKNRTLFLYIKQRDPHKLFTSENSKLEPRTNNFHRMDATGVFCVLSMLSIALRFLWEGGRGRT